MVVVFSKKKIALVLAMVMLLSLLGACARTEQEIEVSESIEEATDQITELDQEEKEPAVDIQEEDAEDGLDDDATEDIENADVSDFKGTVLFNGSSTLAPVISAIAADYNENYGTWYQVDPGFADADIAIYVSSGGSGQGAKSVIEGTTDFGMLAREAKEEEKEQIEDYNELLVGVDALTITINPANPLADLKDDLTKEEIKNIFSGEFATWADLDPSLPEEEIIVITRDVNGGAHGVFQKAIMGDTEVKADAIQAASMGELVQNVIDNPNAIGYGSFGVVNQNADAVTTISVDGVEASKENIVDGSYPIQRPLLLIWSGQAGPEETAFLDLIVGAEGQAIVEEMGFVPVN